MDVLDLRIMQYVAEMDTLRKQQLIAYLETNKTSSSAKQQRMSQCLERARQSQAELQNKYGDGHVFNSLDVLHELREERLNELLGDR
jgi:hypothetical protein